MKLTNDQFDIADCGIERTWRQALVYGLIPLGRLQRGGGPGFWMCARLWFWHRLGGGLCRLAMRFEKQAIGIYAFLVGIFAKKIHK
ncbi:MAG: hypothetical protein KKG09_00370 [Verrucomicrobia bacterium]|nr:hypothetical protein [Verrucomicrobiota bacterium]MCG2679647.1 hypothetical protein [Kiritimatiellia bacterium]MBU4247952.1 hypothetical protein [Verrucomicrobiota bacterium]MBU4291449.1 hypothetical protein [Verrucomicrobiota bacterium]MBU4428371.1 hypothetical protein [Verrucomicrobiota bacterium]